MKKEILCGLLVLILISLVSAEVRLNEIEMNPDGKDSGNEWLELYSEEEVNLSNYSLVNSDDEVFELNVTFDGYYVINFDSQWLDNNDEEIVLKDGDGEVVDESDLLEDKKNDGRTWQFCDAEWIFVSSSEEEENNCDEEPELEEENKKAESVDEAPPTDEGVSDELPVVNESINEEGEQKQEIIKLTTKNLSDGEAQNLKTEEKILYKSNTEFVKEYAIYGFALLCVVLIILLLVENAKLKR